jgi:hypothetical protein
MPTCMLSSRIDSIHEICEPGDMEAPRIHRRDVEDIRKRWLQHTDKDSIEKFLLRRFWEIDGMAQPPGVDPYTQWSYSTGLSESA